MHKSQQSVGEGFAVEGPQQASLQLEGSCSSTAGHYNPFASGIGLEALVRGTLTFRYLLDSRLESSAVRDVMPLALPGDIGVAGCTEGVAMEPRYW